jgi:hypothetical protein
MLAFPGHVSDRLAWRTTYTMIFVQCVAALLLLLTPWYPSHEWPCSSEGFAEAESHLTTNCTVDSCVSITSYALYAHSTCSENNVCIYSERKACTAPINSAAFHRFTVVAHLGCWPLFVGIVSVMFGRKLKWDGSRVVGAGTVIVMLGWSIQTGYDWFDLSLGREEPWCNTEWAGFVCQKWHTNKKVYFVLAKLQGFVLLCVFGRAAVWVSKLRNTPHRSKTIYVSTFLDNIQDSIVSYQRQHPIRSAPGYVMSLSVMSIFFPYVCAALMRALIDFMGTSQTALLFVLVTW